MDGDLSLGMAGSSLLGRGSEAFPDPFCDMASLAMPRTIQSAMLWCQFIVNSNGIYRSALERTLKYFLTNVEIKGDKLSREEKEDCTSYLVDELEILQHLGIAGLDEVTYGNTFQSIVEGFDRYFACPTRGCGLEFSFDTFFGADVLDRKWSNFAMRATCPRCRKSAEWKMVDRRNGKLSLKRWSPHEMELHWDPFSDLTEHTWKIPEDYRRAIREGRQHVLRRAPREVIDAVKANGNFRFAEEYIYHGKERTLAGNLNRGWGISRVLTNFRQAWYVQVLHRYNEAIGLDYIIPFRLITPDSRNGASAESSDPLLSMDMSSFGGQIEEMLRARRRDPAGWNILPFPVKYQALGGEATQLAPRDLLDQGIKTLLNACNVPVELYDMNLSVQAAPMALRLFESTNRSIPHMYNGMLRYVMQKLARLKDWPAATATMASPTLVDDISKQMPRLQLMASGAVSQTTGLAAAGLDFAEETKRKLDEQRFAAEEQEKIQDDMMQRGIQKSLAPPPVMQLQQQGGGGQPAPGGGAAPGMDPASANFAIQNPPPGDAPTDPRELLSQAQAQAAFLLSQPESVKDSRLIQLKKTNPLLHMATRDAIDRIRNDARQQGGAQQLAAQFGKAGHWGASNLRRIAKLRDDARKQRAPGP